MTWITILWPMVTATCVTMALIHLRIGLRRSLGTPHLLFSLNAVFVAVFSCLELASTRIGGPAQFQELERWLDFLGAAVLVSLTAFVWVFLGTGRKWLAFLGPILTCISLAGDLLPVPRALFLQITDVRTVQTFAGATYTVPEGVRATWPPILFYMGMFVTLVFVADASITLWRQGARHRAGFGWVITLFLLGAGVQCTLVDAGILRMPYLVSFFYLAILVAMGMELSADVLRAAELARDLRESDERMELAASAAGLGLWSWDIAGDEIWATDKARDFFGLIESEPVDLNKFLLKLHPDDREPVTHAVAKSMNGDGEYESEHRIVIPGKPVRWIAAHGRVEFNGAGKPVLMRGISLDITARKQTEMEVQQQRSELAHLSRVTMLGELSGSLAHELNQPLTAILSNAQAAQRFLAHDEVDLVELREILADIVAQDKRAGEVIHRLRVLLKKGEVQNQPIDVNNLVLEVLKLVRSDLVNHGVTVQTELAPDLPVIPGDRVQFQQVMLNLVMNACDAMSRVMAAERQVIVRTKPTADRGVEVSVSDCGHGIPTDKLERIFEPFFTTKANGMGLGLSVCQTIVTAHGGKLWAENNPESGATFYFTQPAAKS